MYDNTIFTQYGVKPIAEDYFVVEDGVFCVADGVTRDTVEGKVAPYPKNKEEVLQWIKHYPNPSGAWEAAKIVAEEFVKQVTTCDSAMNENILLEIVKKVNQQVWQINKDRTIDYIKEDLYCCEAVGGVIVEDKLYCFSIGDCHITALDKECNVVFTTINNHLQFEEYLEKVYQKEHSFQWENPEDRALVRKEYRNRPDKKYQGKEVSFGALTGEKEAEYYVDVYTVPLEQVEYICAYSDGCEPIFEKKETIREIVQEPEKLSQEGKERTLILYEKK